MIKKLLKTILLTLTLTTTLLTPVFASVTDNWNSWYYNKDNNGWQYYNNGYMAHDGLIQVKDKTYLLFRFFRHYANRMGKRWNEMDVCK